MMSESHRKKKRKTDATDSQPLQVSRGLSTDKPPPAGRRRQRKLRQQRQQQQQQLPRQRRQIGLPKGKDQGQLLDQRQTVRGTDENFPSLERKKSERCTPVTQSCTPVESREGEKCTLRSVPRDLALSSCNEEQGGNTTDPSPNGINSDSRKKRRRRHRAHKAGEHHPPNNQDRPRWKPYSEMTWEERQAVDEKEAIRATTKREARMALGQPMAPYNTTQFLMDQHDLASDVITPQPGIGTRGNSHGAARRLSGSLEEEVMEDTPSSEDGGCSIVGREATGENDETIFLQKDFADAYENFRAERLQSLTKDELIRDYVVLETRLEEVYTRLGDLDIPQGIASVRVSGLEEAAQCDPIVVLRDELKRLRDENKKLSEENQQLKRSAH